MKPSPQPADDELGRLAGLSLSRQQVDRDGNGGEPCLDAEVLASYADGGLSAAARAEAERHLAVCGWCRRALLFQVEGAFQVEADSDRALVAAEADADVEAIGAVAGAAKPAELAPAPAPGSTRAPAIGDPAGTGAAPAGQRGRVLAWPGVRRAARTWLPIAATLVVGAGLWFALWPTWMNRSPAGIAQSSSPPAPSSPAPREGIAAPDATRAREQERQPKTDVFDSKDRSGGGAPQIALGERLQEAGADPKQKVAASPRSFGAEEANRALKDAPAPALPPAQSALASRAAQAEDARAGADAGTPAASAPTFRSGVPVRESTLARAKTEPPPPPARPNATAAPGKPQGNAAARGLAGGTVGGVVAGQAPAQAREADALAARQAPGGQQAGQPQTAVDRIEPGSQPPTQQAPAQTAQVNTTNAAQTANQFQIVSGPTNAQSNVNVQTNTATQNAAGQNPASQGAAGQSANQSPASPGAATQNAGSPSAANQNAANQRGTATGDRADRDESRREAPQRAANEPPRAANEKPAAAPAPPPPAAPTFGVAADARQADAAKAGAPSNTAGAGGGARSTEAAEGKVASVASKPAARTGEAGAAAGTGRGAKPADGEAADKPADAVAKRAGASAPPATPAAPAESVARAPGTGRGVGAPETVTVTSPFPNVVRSVVNGRRWWRIRDGNTIEGSFDGGFTWTVEYSDPEASIARGAVTRSDDCWMVGAKGLVLRFERGRGWTRVASPTTRALVSITPTSARAATVTDESGQRYQTTDGGLTWRSVRR